MRLFLSSLAALGLLLTTVSASAAAPELSRSRLPLVQITCVAKDGSPVRVNIGTFPDRIGRYMETLSNKAFRPQDAVTVTVRFEENEAGVRSFKNHPFYLTIATSVSNDDGTFNGTFSAYGFPSKVACRFLPRN